MAKHVVIDRARVELEMSKRGWTQSTLAGLCGVGQSAIARMLSSRPKFSTRLLGDVARAFGLQVEALLVTKPAKPGTPDPEQPHRDAHIAQQPLSSSLV